MNTKTPHSITILLIAFGLLLTCSSNEDVAPVPDPTIEPFNLIDVSLISEEIDIRPVLAWEEAISPNSNVSYDLYLAKDNENTRLFSENITQTHLDINESTDISLFYNTDYSWHVIAKNEHGQTISSDTLMFTTRGLKAQLVNINATWGANRRRGHTVAWKDDLMWIFGGRDGNMTLGDAHYSPDMGETWIPESLFDNGYTPRYEHATVVFDGGEHNGIYTIGGINNDSSLNTVLYSLNGSVWNSIGVLPPDAGVYKHTATIFNDKIWVINGRTTNGMRSNKIYSSNSVQYGTIWEEEPDPPFGARVDHASVVFKDKLWVIGGNDVFNVDNDIWYTENGSDWTAIPNPGFNVEEGMSLVVSQPHLDTLWLIGGEAIQYSKDVWYTKDGVNWHQIEHNLPFEGRTDFGVLSKDNKIYLIGGQGPIEDDVWVLE